MTFSLQKFYKKDLKMSQFQEISNDEVHHSFHETIKSIRDVCDQDRIHEDNDEIKKEHQNVGFFKILILY